MKKTVIAVLFFAGLFYLLSAASEINKQKSVLLKQNLHRQWEIKSVDTMKYSRDLALEYLNDESFDKSIEDQIKSIVSTGANYVAIGTPYDDQFLPVLYRWVNIARRHNLNIWFRGNFSAWQGWFGYTRNLNYRQHIELTRNFIANNSDLFFSGDIFSPCPECENGGPGDPRDTQLVYDYRQFLIDERNAALAEFNKIEKQIKVADSMNYDVAKLIMDKATAEALGNIIVIDHYVAKPMQLSQDIKTLAENTNSRIILGEFGAPIPDIHGSFNEIQQATWINEALDLVSHQPELIGINYWVSHGGSTAIFTTKNTQKPAARILEKYFKLEDLPD